MSTPPLPDLVLYGRADCGLCDEARDLVRLVLAERATRGQPVPTLIERDIEDDPAWQRAYFATIPVLELGERRLELVTSLAKVRRLLSDVLGEASAPAAR